MSKPTPTQIIEVVANFYGLRPFDILEHRRSQPATHARQVAMYLCRDILGWSFSSLGEAFGRDHSSIIQAVRRVEHHIDASELEELKAMIVADFYPPTAWTSQGGHRALLLGGGRR